MKLASPGHPKRWVLSNYYKHLKTHQKKITSPKNPGMGKTQSIDKFICYGPKKLKTSKSPSKEIETSQETTSSLVTNIIEDKQNFHKGGVINEADNSNAVIRSTPYNR